MSKKIIESPDMFKSMAGNFLGYSEWKQVTQKEIDRYNNKDNRPNFDL